MTVRCAIALLLLILSEFAASYHDYGDSLSKAILFFEGQRSGYHPTDQRLTWWDHSGLGDGWTVGADLTGGYYDAGDNVKFNFPMAFTTAMLAGASSSSETGCRRRSSATPYSVVEFVDAYLSQF